MIRAGLAIVLCCATSIVRASEVDRYDCFGAGRYQAMSEGRVCPDYPDLPAGVTCDQVRSLVATHGRKLALSWARRNGYSSAQMREAEKCLR